MRKARPSLNTATHVHCVLKVVNCCAVKRALWLIICRAHTLPSAVYRVGTGPVRFAPEPTKTVRGRSE